MIRGLIKKWIKKVRTQEGVKRKEIGVEKEGGRSRTQEGLKRKGIEVKKRMGKGSGGLKKERG